MNILFITMTRYPDSSAMSVRHHALAKLLTLAGHHVVVYARGTTTAYKRKEYDGITYASFRGDDDSTIGKLKDYYMRAPRTLKKLLKTDEFDGVLVAGATNHMLRIIKTSGQKRQMVLMHDSVDWFSAEQFKLGILAPEYRRKQYWMTKGIDNSFKVIAISRYLENHFQSQGIQTVRIPVIMDVQNMSCEKKTEPDKLVLLYAGSPGKKDYLKEIVQGCALLPEEEREKFELRLAGVTREQLNALCDVPLDVIQKLGDSLKAMGRLSRDAVLEQLKQADFTVLLRSPDLRYAKAGFPTKVVESLASATPVLSNITSDLGDYIRDGEEGLVVCACTAHDFAQTVQKALNLTHQQKSHMQQAARKCAEENFDYRLYQDKITELVMKEYT